MPAMPNNVDFFNPYVWRRFVQEAPVNMNFIGENYLPFEDTSSDKIEWSQVNQGQPLAPFVSVGAESPLIDKEQMSKRFAETLFVRFKGALNEYDVRLIRDLQTAPSVVPSVDAMRRTAMANIAKLKLRLNKSVDARVEWMRIKALLGGMVVTPTIGAAQEGTSAIQFTISFPVLTKSALTDGAGYWDTYATADPILDFLNWFADMPWQPGEIIMSKTNLLHLIKQQKLRDAMFTNVARVPTTITAQQAQTYMSDVLGVKFTLYDAMYYVRSFDGTKWTSTPTRFLPKNKIIVLPDSGEKPGAFLTAPSPYDQNWGTGKFAWDFDPRASGQIKEPLIWETGVGIYGMPVLEYPDRVMVVQITA